LVAEIVRTVYEVNEWAIKEEKLLEAPNRIIERIFKELVPDPKLIIQKLKYLGVIYEENGLRFSRIGENLSDVLRQSYDEVSRMPHQRELPATKYFAPAALTYISRNLLSFAIDKCKTLKSKRKKAGFF